MENISTVPSHDLGFKKDSDVPSGYLSSVIVFLIVFTIIAFALKYLLNKYPGFLTHLNKNIQVSEKKIKKIESTRVSPASTIHLVEVDGTRVLIVESSMRTNIYPMSDSFRFESHEKEKNVDISGVNSSGKL